MEPVEKLKKVRLEKLEKIKSANIEPYPARVEKKNTISESLEMLGKKVQTAGRLMGLRGHGGSTFADLADEGAKIQLFFKRDKLGEKDYDFLNNVDIGDFISVSGKVIKTVAGQITIDVESYILLSKAIRPLPSTWHGLKDVEIRYRKRYLDLLLNNDVKLVLTKRTKIIQALRSYFIEQGFLEVETPVLQPLYGGAAAKPFKTHHNALDSDFYLKISDELYLKRLIVGGLDKVFEIDTDFRNEGIDKSHNPEFTMLEAYKAYSDYKDMMILFEGAYSYVSKNALGTTKIKIGETQIDFGKPWDKITMFDAIKKYLGYEVEKLKDEEIKNLLKKHKLKYENRPTLTGTAAGFSRGIAIATLFELCEPYLIKPTIVYNYPKETTALCKPIKENPDLIERFEAYLGGIEVSNAYSELNDPILQNEYFQKQVESAKSGDEEAHPMDNDFIETLEYGMPPTGGIGMGVDRMVMLLTGAENIKEVIFFPTLKPEK